MKSIQVKTVKIPSVASASTVVNSSTVATGSMQDTAKKGSDVVPVKPMAKASSARTSRILEGSMDSSN